MPDSNASDNDGQYDVNSPLEVDQILQNLARRAVLLTAAFGAGDEFFLTSIVAIDAAGGQMWIETASSQQVERVLRAPRLLCAGSLEKVQIQFSCTGIEAAEYEGRPALKVALPRSLKRLQRREHFRIQTPVVAPLKCVVTIATESKRVKVELPVADISCGGIALTSLKGQFDPEPGVSYPCTLSLPGAGSLNATIELHHACIVKGANGKESQRLGFAFVNPPGPMATAIQRYIMQLERERRAKMA